ncbi:phosphodiester glycosidase family protein [Candidatus Woesearchaeota archaeon]|nr:phosphodiester glycosidase family protein [Candidatus Woesearchaeota archaeon]
MDYTNQNVLGKKCPSQEFGYCQVLFNEKSKREEKGLKLIKGNYQGNDVYTIQIDSTLFDVEVVTARTTIGKTFAETKQIMTGGDGIAAINGGYYHANGKNSGWLIENGKIVKNTNDEDEINAYFVVRDAGNKKEYSIVKEEEFNSAKVIFALSAISYIKDHKLDFPCSLMKRAEYCPEKSQRAVIGIKDDGEVDLVISKNLSVYEFGDYLSKNYKDAISLDSGGSVSMEYHFDGKDESIGWEYKALCKKAGKNWPCQRNIPNAIIVKEKV